jgi:hypothetical protein
MSNNTKRGHARATSAGLIAKGWERGVRDLGGVYWTHLDIGAHFIDGRLASIKTHTFHQAVKIQQQRERGE